ncbi:MAG: ABC transporter substrate-binding protein [Anaerolineae bacterium]
MEKLLSRRSFLKVAGLAAGAAGLAACKPEVVVETVEKVVKETVLVEGEEKVVEKVVKETVVVEKEVVVEAQPPVTINFWGWPSPVWDDKLAIFKEQEPNITVNTSEIGDAVFGSQKFLTAVAAGTGPDVSIANRHTFMQFAAKGMYMDITPYFDVAGLRRDDYLAVQLEETTWDGVIYGLPIATDTRFLYWNRAYFEEAGLDPNTPPKTYNELAEYTEKLTVYDNNGDVERYGFVPYLYGNSWMWLYGFLNKAPSLSEDKRTILCTDPRWVETLQWLVDFYDSYVGDFELANTFSQGISSAGLGEPFDAGKVAMVADGDWAVARHLRNPDLDWAAAPMPIPPNGEIATWSCGWSLVIPPSAKEPEAGWELMRWWTTEEGWRAEAEAQKKETVRVWQREQIEGVPKFWPALACHLPSLQMLEDEYIPELDQREQDTWAMSLDLLKNHTRGCGTEMGVAALEYWVEMDNAARMALAHEKSPEEALEDCRIKVQQATDEAWEAIEG